MRCVIGVERIDDGRLRIVRKESTRPEHVGFVNGDCANQIITLVLMAIIPPRVLETWDFYFDGFGFGTGEVRDSCGTRSYVSAVRHGRIGTNSRWSSDSVAGRGLMGCGPEDAFGLGECSCCPGGGVMGYFWPTESCGSELVDMLMHDTDIIGIRRCLGGVHCRRSGSVRSGSSTSASWMTNAPSAFITTMMPLAAPAEIYDAWIFSSDSDGTFVFAKRGAVSDLFIVIYTGDGPVVIGFRR